MKIKLKSKVEKELKEIISNESNTSSKWRKAKVILLVSEEKTFLEISGIIGIKEKTVRRWTIFFLLNLLKEINFTTKVGRKRKLSDKQIGELMEYLCEMIDRHEVISSPHVKYIIKEKFNVDYSVKYISQLLRNLGFSFKKSQQLYYKEKENRKWWKDNILPLVRKKKEQGYKIYYNDEVSFSTKTNKSYGWSFKNERLKLPFNGKSQNLHCFGFLRDDGKFVSYETADQKNMITFMLAIKKLINEEKNEKIFLILDRAPYHKNDFILELLKVNNIEVQLLPPSSPYLNPIEHLWSVLKNKFIRPEYFPNFSSLVDQVSFALSYFKKSYKRTLTSSGLLSMI